MRDQESISDDLDRIESYIVRLNIDSPIDRWWRKKHNVAFNSAEHRAISIIDQYAEWYEDNLYKEAAAKIKKRQEDPYLPGDFLYSREEDPSFQTVDDDEFDSIDLSDSRWQTPK